MHKVATFPVLILLFFKKMQQKLIEKLFCSTGESPRHLTTTEENLEQEILEKSKKRDELEMKVHIADCYL